MDLNNLIYVVALLACPVGMGLMMWMMSRNMGGDKGQSVSDTQMTAGASAARLDALRAQRQALEAEIAEVTKLTELEARREALLAEQVLAMNETGSTKMIQAPASTVNGV